MWLEALPPELLDHLSSYLDLKSTMSLSSVNLRLRQHFSSSSSFWKRLALRHYCLHDRGSLLYGPEGEEKGSPEQYKRACLRYRLLRNNLEKGIHTAWRFNLDPARDYLIPLNGEGQEESSRGSDEKLKSRYDMSETFFSLDWNGDYAVMIVCYQNISEIFVWKTRSPSPSFFYAAVKVDIQITCKNFAIYEKYLVITRSQSRSILSSYDMENGMTLLGDACDPSIAKESSSSSSASEEFVEILTGGKIVTFSFRNAASPCVYVINIYDLSILHKYSIDPGFTRDFTFLYHVEHRPLYRNGVALNFPSKSPLNGMFEPIYDFAQNHPSRDPHFYLASIREDGIRLYPGGGISCFGMDITEEGHILGLINRLDSERSEGIACVALYRRDSNSRYDDKEKAALPPHILHDFRGKSPFLLKGSYLNRQMDDWTGDHQIKLCHERNLAVVMTNSSKRILTFLYDKLGSPNPSFNIHYEIDYTEFRLNDLFNTLTLAVSRHVLALADNATIVLRDVFTGRPLNVLQLPEHASSDSASEDDFGLGFLLINDSDILAHYFCPHVFPDAFDIFKFYP